MSDNAHRAFASIFHPTDFSASSHTAFDHALKLAVANRSHFCVSHVATSKDKDGPGWSDYPHIRETLMRWSQLPEDSAKHDVSKNLGVFAKKVERISKDPLQSIVRFLESERADLIVLSTEGREGLPRWLQPSFSEALVRQAMVATLFVPAGVKGFVSHETGRLSLNRVLIPTDRRPHPGVGLDVVGGLLRSLQIPSPRIEALYVGDPYDRPSVHAPEKLDCIFEPITRSGHAVDAILEQAMESRADLIVMVTEGRHGFLDALRGSTTEQIVRQSPCPVLAVPASS